LLFLLRFSLTFSFIVDFQIGFAVFVRGSICFARSAAAAFVEYQIIAVASYSQCPSVLLEAQIEQ